MEPIIEARFGIGDQSDFYEFDHREPLLEISSLYSSEEKNGYENLSNGSQSLVNEGLTELKEPQKSDMILVPDGHGNMVDPSLITRKYLGVTYHKRNKKWIAQASENGRSKYLGCFKTPEKAARMYDSYVVSKGGKDVKTNFPVSEVDKALKPAVKRYRKRSRHLLNQSFLPISSSISPTEPPQNTKTLSKPDSWEAFYPPSSASTFPKRLRKKQRDPNAPKGPRNAYMIFIQRTREKLQKEMQEKSTKKKAQFGTISKELGKRWKALMQSEKKVFEDEAALDKIRHRKEMEEYEKSLKKDTLESAVPEPFAGGLSSQYTQLQQLQWMQLMSLQAQCVPQNQTEQKDESVSNILSNYTAQFNPQQSENYLKANVKYYFEQYEKVYKSLGYSDEVIEQMQQIYIASLTAQTNAFSQPQVQEGNLSQSANQIDISKFFQQSSQNLLSDVKEESDEDLATTIDPF